MREIFREITFPIAIGIVFAIAAGAALVYYAFPRVLPFLSTEGPTISINEVPIRVFVASTTAARVKGLSGIRELPDDAGLLMIFEEEEYQPIWMKDMFFPIDVIWIDNSFRIVDIRHNLAPETYPEIFEPKEKARFVLETNALFATAYSFKIGDEVKIPMSLLSADLVESR